MTGQKITRWTAGRKHELVGNIVHGATTIAEVREEYPDLSEEELNGWIALYKSGGGDSSNLRQVAITKRRLVHA